MLKAIGCLEWRFLRQMNPQHDPESKASLVELGLKLKALFDEHCDKRISVVGTFCVGKTTLVRNLPGAQDMDDLLLPKLSKEETECVYNTPWSEDLGRYVIRLARERVLVEPGKPVFGTVVLECDLIVHLTISGPLLRERTSLRKTGFEDGKRLQAQIEQEIRQTALPVIEFTMG
jgi:hypothetical protein